MRRRTEKYTPFDPQYIYLTEGEMRKEHKRTPFPTIDGRQGYKCDLHIHTSLSDGNLTPKERIDEALATGMDVIALTDHSPFAWRETQPTNEAYNEAVEYGKKVGIKVIKGVELTCCKPVGHIGILFADDTDKYLFPTFPINEKQAAKAARQAHAEGAFTIYNHPGWPDHESTLGDFQTSLIKEGVIEGIEVMSGHEFYPISIDYCNALGLTPLSTSDLHRKCDEEYSKHVGRNYTIVYADSKNESSLLEALRTKRTIAVSGNLITGREGLLRTLISASLDIHSKKLGAENYLVEIENHCDIEFRLEGEHGQLFCLPAHQKQTIYCGAQDLRKQFFVRNAFTGSQTNLSVNLCKIFGLQAPSNSKSEATNAFALPDDRYECTIYEGEHTGVSAIEHGRSKASMTVETDDATNKIAEGLELYGLKFERTLNIPAEGEYDFAYVTNGLTRIYIDHNLVACNDSMCRITEETITVRLTRGWHLIQIYYVQDFRDEHFCFKPLFNI